MNIVIDQGNTSAKVALFDNKELIESFRFKPLTEADLNDLFDRFPLSRGILCSVGEFDTRLVALLSERLNYFTELSPNLKLPIRLDYKTPDTLGKDRIAAAVGAHYCKPGANLLIIDAGTAITYDFVDESGTFRGGNISPGMTARFRSLHRNTKQLPMLDEEGDIPPLGYDTETAIRSGVVDGIVREMVSYIEEYEKKHNVFTFLTGGHGIYFANKLKTHIFADGNLVLKGLNEILTHQ